MTEAGDRVSRACNQGPLHSARNGLGTGGQGEVWARRHDARARARHCAENPASPRQEAAPTAWAVLVHEYQSASPPGSSRDPQGVFPRRREDGALACCPWELAPGGDLRRLARPPATSPSSRCCSRSRRRSSTRTSAGVIHRDLKPANVLFDGARPCEARGLRRLRPGAGCRPARYHVRCRPSAQVPSSCAGEPPAAGGRRVRAGGALAYELLSPLPAATNPNFDAAARAGASRCRCSSPPSRCPPQLGSFGEAACSPRMRTRRPASMARNHR